MSSNANEAGGLQRRITWVGVFWVVSGVPAYVLITLGDIAATVGTPSWLIWTTSVLIGFVQGFVYAEMAGLFPNKSGGASVYGAAGWVRYSKVIAPVSVWCNWLAWSPVLALGCTIAAGYILEALFAPGSSVHGWRLVLFDLSFIRPDLHVRINSTFAIGLGLMLLCFAIQHRGIMGTARLQTVIGLAVIVPLLLVGLVPILLGEVELANFEPFVPGPDPETAQWDKQGWVLIFSGLFLAGYSAYAFETAICYTSELTNPKTDTLKAIVFSGLLCIACFFLVPFTFQGALGLEKLIQPDIADGTGVAAALASLMGSGGGALFDAFVVMMVLALMLGIMTGMAGSARTLYQGGVDGWLPKYLAHANRNGAPTRAMWTDLGFNLFLLSLSDYLFIIAISNVCYMVFTFLNVNACWLHRIDAGHVKRPWRVPTWLLALAVVLSFFNLFLLGASAHVFGADTLLEAGITIALILPVFLFRHYVTDRGRFPARMLEDLHPGEGKGLPKPRAGALPFLALALGLAVVLTANWAFS